jgi:hypothetical protein
VTLGLFWRLLKVSMPLYLIALPLIAIFGWLNPWPPARQALSPYPGQTAITISLSYSSKWVSSQGTTRNVSRSYILLPWTLQNAKVVLVNQRNGDIPRVSESTVEFLLFVGWLLISLFGTWWYWIRPRVTDAA